MENLQASGSGGVGSNTNGGGDRSTSPTRTKAASRSGGLATERAASIMSALSESTQPGGQRSRSRGRQQDGEPAADDVERAVARVQVSWQTYCIQRF